MICLCLFPFTRLFAHLTVRPMLVHHEAIAGKSSEIVLRLENTSSTTALFTTVRIMELIQLENGRYIPVEPNDPNISPCAASCRKWLSPGRDKNRPIEVAPQGKIPICVAVQTPDKAKGFHCAALSITQRPSSPTGLFATKFEYIIPLLITIKDRPGICQVNPAEVGLEYARIEDVNDISNVCLDIHNTGQTYNRIETYARINGYRNGEWTSLVERVDIDQMSIIPGSRLRLKAPLPSLLTPGCYEVIGYLVVDEEPAVMLKKRVRLLKKTEYPISK